MQRASTIIPFDQNYLVYIYNIYTNNIILERGGRKVGGGKYRRDRKREKLNEEKNNKKNKITVSITRTNARSRC